MSKVITLLNEKGGVGKTTVATHLAADLAIRGDRVLLIDSDGQGHATILLGLQKEPGFYTLAAVWGQEHEDEEKVDIRRWLRRVPHENFASADADGVGPFYLVPGNVRSKDISSRTTDAYSVLRIVHHLAANFDWIIFDTSPAPSITQSMILMATDRVIIPTKCEFLAFDGVVESMAHINQHNEVRQRLNLAPVKVMGIVPTIYRPQTIEHSENLESLIQQYGTLVWDPIQQYTSWTEVTRQRRTIFAEAPNSRAATSARNLTAKFLQEVLNVETR